MPYIIKTKISDVFYEGTRFDDRAQCWTEEVPEALLFDAEVSVIVEILHLVELGFKEHQLIYCWIDSTKPNLKTKPGIKFPAKTIKI